MICDRTEECAKKTHHVVVDGKRKKGKGKKISRTKTATDDIYKQSLNMPPCGDIECQKKCIVFLDRRSQAKCEEKGMSYVLDQGDENPRHEMMMYHVDGGIVSGADENKVCKCDYLLLIKDSVAPCGDGAGTAILIELKGTGTRHALEQISATLKQKELQPLWDSQRRIYGRIICRSSPPRIRNTEEFMDLQDAFMHRGGRLDIFEEYKAEKYADLNGKG